MSDIIIDKSHEFGQTGFYKSEGAAATASVVAVFSGDCSSLTGKKAIGISQTTAVAGEITYAVYGSYDSLISQTDFETLMAAADTEKIFSIGSGAVDSGGTQQAEVTTTNPYKWIGVTVVGNTFTYNLYAAGC